MAKRNPYWKRTFEQLKAAGLSKEQALLVHRILDENRGFHYYWLSIKAKEFLEQVYKCA